MEKQPSPLIPWNALDVGIDMLASVPIAHVHAHVGEEETEGKEGEKQLVCSRRLFFLAEEMPGHFGAERSLQTLKEKNITISAGRCVF
jgi:hypothetical protein